MSDFTRPDQEPVQAALKASVVRLTLLIAVDRGLVMDDRQGVPHINLGTDGWVPIPAAVGELRKAKLIDLMLGSDDWDRWRKWRITTEGATAMKLDLESWGWSR